MSKGTHNPFYVYIEWLDLFDMLTMPECGILAINILRYAKGDELLPMEDKALSMAFRVIKSQLDRDHEKYAEKCVINRENGLKGGRPKKETERFFEKPSETEEKRTKAKKPDKDKDKDKDKEYNPPISPKGGERALLFEKFYSAYPKKKSKEQARKAFEKLKPDDELLDTMLSALEKQKLSEDWQKDNGQYIPLPSTWLNGKRWEDEITEHKAEDKPDKYAGINWGIVL